MGLARCVHYGTRLFRSTTECDEVSYRRTVKLCRDGSEDTASVGTRGKQLTTRGLWLTELAEGTAKSTNKQKQEIGNLMLTKYEAGFSAKYASVPAQ